MKCLLKYSLLFLLSVVYVGSRTEQGERAFAEAEEVEHVSDESRSSSQELVLLTTLNANALPVNTVHEVSHTFSVFRYLPRNNFAVAIEGYQSTFPVRFKDVKNDYLDVSALKQEMRYYVYALREIIV